MTANDAPLRPRANVLLTEMRDGTGVLLDLDSKFYFNLNATGLEAWKALEAAGERGLRPSELARSISERYQIEQERALADVAALFAELSAEGLLVPTGEGSR